MALPGNLHPGVRGLERRTLLKAGLLAAASLALPAEGLARLLSAPPEKSLSFYNVHTGETLNRAVFWAGGEFIPETMREFNHLLRDYRTDEILPLDPRLFDLLFVLRRRFGSTEPFHVISGYRSPATNALLRRQGHGVAKHSLHMEGKAIDIRLPGVRLADLRRAALDLKRGGVGYYPDSDFVHVDTGRVRFW